MKILVFPKDQNPYQELLYAPLRKNNKLQTKYIRRLPFLGSFFMPVILIYKRILGYKLIHIHWPAFNIDIKIPGQKYISYLLFQLSTLILKFLRYRIVWTVHNLMPHESQTTNDLRVAQVMSKISSKVIVHSKETILRMNKLKIDTNNTIVVPHGNYKDIYPNNISRKAARKIFNIGRNDLVLLFFGLIRPYKGVDELVDTYKKLDITNVHLIIAGKCDDTALKEKLNHLIKDSNIIFHNKYIEKSEVATYFNASDIVCLPFKAITTSGSALLALTFGKPIIAPNSGSIKEFPKTLGYIYDPKKPYALESAIRKAILEKDKLKYMGLEAQKYSDSISWDKIAQKTYLVYREVLNEK